MGPCQVCGRPAVVVCSSALGAASFPYCAECHYYGAEPYDITVALAPGPLPDGATVEDAYAAWFLPVLWATLLRAGKTAAEFWADVAAHALKEASWEREHSLDAER